MQSNIKFQTSSSTYEHIGGNNFKLKTMEKKQTAVNQIFLQIKAARKDTKFWNDSMLVDWLLESEERFKQMEKEQNQLELPSDEEIDDEATNYIENASAYSFVMGAEWMRDKIKGGNNE